LPLLKLQPSYLHLYKLLFSINLIRKKKTQVVPV